MSKKMQQEERLAALHKIKICSKVLSDVNNWKGETWSANKMKGASEIARIIENSVEGLYDECIQQFGK